MFKYAFLIINFFSVLFVTSALEDGVIIEDNTPAVLAPGEERIVEISINKGDVHSFAKLQIDLPDGLTAEAGATFGASFTFKDQKAKFIWMELPQEQVFTVSYKLKADPSAKGNKVITGAFSYIKSNQRVDYEMQSKMVEIGGSVADTQTPQNGGSFACIRTVTDMGSGEFLVKLDVVNAANEGFVKIRENIPTGFTAIENESRGAILTIDAYSVKYIWFDAPLSSSYSVSYRLTGGMGDPELSGTFSYVESDAPREMAIMSSGTIVRAEKADTADQPDEDFDELNNDSNAQNDADAKAEREAEAQRLALEEQKRATEAKKLEEAKAEADRLAAAEQKKKEEAERIAAQKRADALAAEKARQDAAARAEKEADDAEASTTTAIPDPETGVSYKVQIAAAHRVVDAKYFKSRHGFDENFGIENHEGWVKYTAGSFEMYKQARDDRERIKNRYDFRGPFVTAYNDGVRITVQEALMITRQKWYK